MINSMRVAADSEIPVLGRIVAITLRKFFNFLGYAGVMFILYGVVSEGTDTVWPPLEKWVNPLSALLTLVGTGLTAISIYYYSPETHSPELFSKYISAPLTIIAALANHRLASGSRPSATRDCKWLCANGNRWWVFSNSAQSWRGLNAKSNPVVQATAFSVRSYFAPSSSAPDADR